MSSQSTRFTQSFHHYILQCVGGGPFHHYTLTSLDLLSDVTDRDVMSPRVGYKYDTTTSVIFIFTDWRGVLILIHVTVVLVVGLWEWKRNLYCTSRGEARTCAIMIVLQKQTEHARSIVSRTPTQPHRWRAHFLLDG